MASGTILVVGAGAAGLGAARRLRAAGREAIVLEGRSRVGGRVHTDRSLGYPVEMGAAWVHGCHGNAIHDLARDLGLPTVLAPHTSLGIVSAGASPPRRIPVRRFQPAFERAAAMAKRLVRTTGQDLSLTEAIRRVAARTDGELPPALRWGLNWAGLIVGEDPDRLSALHWDQDEELPGPDAVFPAGYDGVMRGLAADLDIRLAHPVRAIRWGDGGVAAVTDRGVVRGAAAVVTVPLGVLKAADIRFDPPLPAEKQRTIRRLGMGLLDKVVLEFPRPLWPARWEHVGDLLADVNPRRFVGFTSLRPYGLPRVLVGWAAGRLAEELEAMTDRQVVERCLVTLRRLFGRSIPTPCEARVSRWGSDPFTRGGYSCIPVGASDHDYLRLATPVGDRLFFAGEATHRVYPGTVHGAYLSGVREARRLLLRSRGERTAPDRASG